MSFKAWYVGGAIHEGARPEWDALPDDGVLAVKVFFSDGTARNCAGDDFYGACDFPDGFWTVIHNRDTTADNARRYPDVSWKRGRWTSEAEIRAVIAEM